MEKLPTISINRGWEKHRGFKSTCTYVKRNEINIFKKHTYFCILLTYVMYTMKYHWQNRFTRCFRFGFNQNYEGVWLKVIYYVYFQIQVLDMEVSTCDFAVKKWGKCSFCRGIYVKFFLWRKILWIFIKLENNLEI